MINPTKMLMNQMGVAFRIERTGELLQGLKNSHQGKRLIQFPPETDIKSGDIVVCIPTSERFYITDTEGVLFQKQYIHINAFCQTEKEHADSLAQKSEHNVFNINNSPNSIIGTNPTVTYNYGLQDVEKLIWQNADRPHDYDELVAALKEILETEQAPKGKLQKFSDAIAKHAWLSGPIATLILNHLTGHIKS